MNSNCHLSQLKTIISHLIENVKKTFCMFIEKVKIRPNIKIKFN